jgi:hypothetical protein
VIEGLVVFTTFRNRKSFDGKPIGTKAQSSFWIPLAIRNHIMARGVLAFKYEAKKKTTGMTGFSEGCYGGNSVARRSKVVIKQQALKVFV